MLKQLVDRLTNVTVVGVDLGSEALKAVELERSERGPILRSCVIEPVNGRDPVALLKQVLTEPGAEVHVALGLASPELVVKPFEFPRMPQHELAKAIQLEAEQAILDGHTASEMAIDWHLTGAGPKKSMRGVLAVVPKTVIESRLAIARRAGLRPVVIDAEGLALWNAWLLEPNRPAERQTVLLLNVGARNTNLIIAATPDELVIVRDFQLGAQAIAAGQGHEWVGEIRDSLAYARSRGRFRGVEAAVVSGGGASQDVATLVAKAAGVPATIWNPLEAVLRDARSPQIPESTGPLLAVALGLALRQPE